MIAKLLSHSKLRFFFLTLFFLFTFLSCDDDDKIVPYRYVNFQISLNDPQFVDLNTIGNSVYLNGGYKGILLFRKTFEEFLAVDRASTYDPHNDSARVVVDETGMSARDTISGSEYSLLLDGAVVKGPAQFPLKMYRTNYDMTTNLLNVFN